MNWRDKQVKAAMEKLVAPLKVQCDRDWSDETPEQVVSIACNAIYWRGDELRQALQEAIDWNDEYQRINNLRGGSPQWVRWAKQLLSQPRHLRNGRFGRYAQSASWTIKH
jgi:hypothetical protein